MCQVTTVLVIFIQATLYCFIFSQSVSLTQYVVLSVRLSARQSVRLFQLAFELSQDVVARRCSDY